MKDLQFETKSEINRINFPIFDVVLKRKKAPNGKEGSYVSIESPDWVSAIVELRHYSYGERFVMVKQFRHGTDAAHVEFPCGMVEKGESPLDAILRECEEEIGLKKEDIIKIEKIYEASPNPAFMNNKMTCFRIVADRVHKDEIKPDENEFLECKFWTDSEVEAQMNRPDSSVMMKLAWEKYKQLEKE